MPLQMPIWCDYPNLYIYVGTVCISIFVSILSEFISEEMLQIPVLLFVHLFCVPSLTIACLRCVSLAILAGLRKSCGHTVSVYMVTILDICKYYSGYDVLFAFHIFLDVALVCICRIIYNCKYGNNWTCCVVLPIWFVEWFNAICNGQNHIWWSFSSYCGLHLPCLAAWIYCLLVLLLLEFTVCCCHCC